MTAISVGMQRRRINYFAHFWQNYTVKQPFLLYQLWKYYEADVTCWQVSQNHRILRLAGTSGGQMAQASAQAGQQESGLCPRSFLNLQGLHTTSPGNMLQYLITFIIKTVFFCSDLSLMCSSRCPLPLVLAVSTQKEPGCSVSFLQVFLYMDEIPQILHRLDSF